MPELNDKLTLHGFNNLTKTLSFNIYDISYALTREAQQQYIDYIDETYNAERLTRILSDVADIIGANILNIARQDYDPQGASVTMLIAEGAHALEGATGEGPVRDRTRWWGIWTRATSRCTPTRSSTRTTASAPFVPTSTCRPAATFRRCGR